MGLFTSYCTNCHKTIEWFLHYPKECKHCKIEILKEDLIDTSNKPWRSYKMKSNFELIKEFHTIFSRTPDPDKPSLVKNDTLELRIKLITEEYKEVLEELGYMLLHDPVPANYPKAVDLPKLAKELADLLYVVYGTAAVYGIPIDDVYREVHRSNMSKLGPSGEVIRREDGKVLKGPNYKEADIKRIIQEAIDGKNSN